MSQVGFGVLGPVAAWDGAGGALALKGPRHREVLGRLLVARRRVVPVGTLVADLWTEPPAGAAGAVQTFVAALRRVLEPDRPPRAPAALLVTDGPGYALRAASEAVDAWRFEAAVGAAERLPPERAAVLLAEALGWWRGPAYAEFADRRWARAERSRLLELRLLAVERLAGARLALGAAELAVPELEAHLTEHPGREQAWRLLALAVHRTGRQGDALAVLRRARRTLAEQLGLDPGPELRRLEARMLAQDPGLADPAPGPEAIWQRAAAAYDRAVPEGSPARLESTVALLRGLAVTGADGLDAARQHRLAVVTAAEALGDPELTARVIGAFDVPALWPRGDDPAQARQVVAAAERTLAALPPGAAHDPARARLLATVAVESRGTRSPRGAAAAWQAEEIARRLDDPALLAFALNGVFLHCCDRAGSAAQRRRTGAELVALAQRHQLASFEVLGRLILLQARCSTGEFDAADREAEAVDRLADRHGRPLARVFTAGYRALRAAATGRSDEAADAYRALAPRLAGAAMPGVAAGLVPLALLGLRLRPGAPRPAVDRTADWGPYRPWLEPLLLLDAGRAPAARAALRALPEPDPGLLYEALCCLEIAGAAELADQPALERARDRLRPAAGELAGAGSGFLSFGAVDEWLAVGC
ncbi:AfsR/SARP family transcriptional regulator [Kitasatospora viridis]|uniref:DNA-binding SARP family transcriptional activator n=1 Tax=Kitasatospora viridis TaxID=281105 RepID=A0A561UAB5_9ACTN|nr:BTAD domain-containing putative transcriptional regulator [Kitasatospora viridis]TWF96294.1 DNA-binding SARP family transcriptional activator [Kitasatospora viridis]